MRLGRHCQQQHEQDEGHHLFVYTLHNFFIDVLSSVRQADTACLGYRQAGGAGAFILSSRGYPVVGKVSLYCSR